MLLGDLDTGKFSIGKAAVFYAPAAWDFASDLDAELLFLGFTEGETRIEPNETFNSLRLPEYTGEAEHKTYVQGEGPVATIPLYTADPVLRAVLSPTGGASGGRRRQQPVVARTLVFLPEELFLDLSDPTLQEDLPLTANGSGFELGGVALTAAQQELMDQGCWMWKGYFMKPPLKYVHADGGKSLDEVTFQLMYQVAAPNGQRLYTLGDPYNVDIDILTGPIGS